MADVLAAAATQRERKLRGAWYTPPDLVGEIVDAVVTPDFLERIGPRPVRVLDPACGDGRFLRVAAERVTALGGRVDLVGVDVDQDAADAAERLAPAACVLRADSLDRDWGDARFDLVLGNPPFLSPLAASTSRRGSSELGGGPYADVAVEFLALAATLADPDRGRVAFVLPQSVLAARDAGPVRAEIDRRATMIWSSWSSRRRFDAQVHTCAVAFEFGRAADPVRPWAEVVTRRHRVPPVPELETAGTLGERARLNANFRDEYYGMIPAVGDHEDGPPLITSGLIDPGECHWGARAVTFARRRFAAPRIDLGALDPKMTEWARRRLVPKVLVANQTRVVEAVCDERGAWLPAVPVVAVYPHTGEAATAWEIAAVLTSAVASSWAWARSAGTGLSADAIRVGPALLAGLPWPAGPLAPAVAALRTGDRLGCARAVHAAFGCPDEADLLAWWSAALDRIHARRPTP